MSESNMIKVRCPECRAKLDVKAKYAGGKVKCPSCDTKIEVPMTAGLPDMPRKSLASATGSGKIVPPKKPKPPAEPMPPSGAFRPDDGMPVDDFLSLLPDSGPCPSCGDAALQDAVICVKCGYNRKTGTKVGAAAGPGPGGVPGGGNQMLLLAGGGGVLLLLIVVVIFMMRGSATPEPPPPEPKPKRAVLPPPSTGDPKPETKVGDAKAPKDDPDPKDALPTGDPPAGREIAPSIRVDLPPIPADADSDADKGASVDAGLPKLEEALAAGSDSDKQRAMEIRHERESWVELYDAVGRRNTDWNDAAHKALHWTVRSAVGRPDAAHDADDVAWAAARRALAAGCDDPLVLFAYLRLSLRYVTAGPADAVKGKYAEALLKAADALRGSNYPATRRCEAYAAAATLFRFLPNSNPKEYTDRILNPAQDLLRLAVKEGPRPACAMLDLLGPLVRSDPEFKVVARQRAYDHWQGLLGQSTNAIQPVFRGERQGGLAWLIYGDGSKEMTPADKKLFVSRLDAAEDTLNKAWEAAQAVPNEAAAAARVMMPVVMGQGRGADRFDLWFRRAADDERNLMETYRAKLLFLSPKWLGAADGHDAINFGRDAVKAGNWASRAPLILAEAHAMLAKAAPDPAAEAAYWRNPVIWEDLKSCYGPYLEAYPKDRAARAACAAAATRTGQWVEASRHFELLGAKPRLDAFEGKREVYDRLRQTAKAEAAKLAG